jgi:spoIIIJ-associated protein
MRVVETEAKTQEEAVQAALTELGLEEDQADVEVLSKEHRGGILGFMGQPVVRVRVSARTAADTAEEPAPAEPTPKAAELERPGEQEPELEGGAPAAETEAPGVTQPEPEETEAQEPAAEPEPSDSADEPSAQEQDGEEDGEEEADYGEGFDWPEEARLLVQDVLDAMGLDITAEVAEADDTDIKIEAAGPDLAILIGREGKTINSFQYLINVILNRQSPERLRVVIDGEGYRDRREQALARMARQAADRARRSGVAVRMDPLRAFERRLIHVALQEDETVSTHSEGEEPYRCVVVAPTERASSPAESEGRGDSSQERQPQAAKAAAGAGKSGSDSYDDFERRWIEEDEEYEYVDTDDTEEDEDSDEDAAAPQELPEEAPDPPAEEDREG